MTDLVLLELMKLEGHSCQQHHIGKKSRNDYSSCKHEPVCSREMVLLGMKLDTNLFSTVEYRWVCSLACHPGGEGEEGMAGYPT